MLKAFPLKLPAANGSGLIAAGPRSSIVDPSVANDGMSIGHERELTRFPRIDIR